MTALVRKVTNLLESAQKHEGQRITPLPFKNTRTKRGLLYFSLEVGRTAIGHIHLKLNLLGLAGEWVPGNNLVLPSRHILDLERPVLFRHGEMRVRDWQEEPLHELMLVAL